MFTGILRGICDGLTVDSSGQTHTAGVIPRTPQKVPFRLELLPTCFAGIAFPAPAAGLRASSIRPQIRAHAGNYRLRLAENREDRDGACRLRFRVFNLELGKGLESSYENGLDSDAFDRCCEHLIVEECASRRIVGTYRLQSGMTAAGNFGYYSEREFSFAPYEPLRAEILELGRAAIDRDHRTPEVLTLLWRGIAQYASDMGLRYLIGCSSLNSNDPAGGWQMYRQLEHYRVPAEFETEATPAYACPIEQQGADAQPLPCTLARSEAKSAPENLAGKMMLARVPKLLKTYLAIGARIAAPPAWDREFRTIDFLTLLDLRLLSSAARNRFLAPLTQ